jgi:hypothetical protein
MIMYLEITYRGTNFLIQISMSYFGCYCEMVRNATEVVRGSSSFDFLGHCLSASVAKRVRKLADNEGSTCVSVCMSSLICPYPCGPQ